MRKTAVVLLAVSVFIAGCNGGADSKKKKKQVKAVAAEWYSFSTEKAVYRDFNGPFHKLEDAATGLYRWIRREGYVAGGSVVLELKDAASVEKAGVFQGRLWLPVMDFRTVKEYTNNRALPAPAWGKFPVGRYFSLRYSGDPEAVEVAWSKLKDEADKKSLDLKGPLLLLFEEPPDRISPGRVLRLMQKAKR